MTSFSDLETAARMEQPPPKKIEAYEKMAWMLLRDLYRRFRKHEISHDAAKSIKAEIQGLFSRAETERLQLKGILYQGQESIRLAGERWETIVHSSLSMTDRELAETLLDIVSAMVGESVTAQAVRKSRPKMVMPKMS